MGKQVKGSSFSDYIVPQSNPVKPAGFSDFVQTPVSKEAGRGLYAQTGAFKGDSDYDNGLVFGNDQNRLRAENQPWYDQVRNSAVKTIPGIALGIVENAGYLGELFSGDQDYTNALTEIAQKGRQGLDEALPNYHKNPGEIVDFSDSAWWIDNGQGLVESIGEFLVTGAAVGSALGNTSKLLSNAVKGTKAFNAVNKIGQVSSTIGTSSILAYTEGAMSGAQVYKDVYDSEINLHGNIEQAKIKASEAASTTVKLNTIINTGLNISSVVPLMKTFNNLYTTSRLGLSRQAGESLVKYGERLAGLEAMGIPQASVKKRLVAEAIQEGLEEDVNLFAESEGRIKGGIEKSSSDTWLKRFLNKAISTEGRLNFALGAVGGIGQTAGMDFAPVRSIQNEDGSKSRVSNHTLNEIRDNEFAKGVIATLQEDISYLTGKQEELNQAVAKGDKVGANRAKEDLFNIAALKSLREGYAQEFSEDIAKIAQIDNTTTDDKGMTEAMRLGYADNAEDNDFKIKALKKANDIKKLSNEYNSIQQVFPDKFVADEVFRQRMNVYSATEFVEDLHKQNTILSNELLKTLTTENASGVVDMAANVAAFKQLITGLNANPNKSKEEKAMLANFNSSLLIEEAVLNQTLESDPSLKAELKNNEGVVKLLELNRAPLLGYNEELKQIKNGYNDLIKNSKKTTEDLTKVKNAFTDKIAKDKETADKEAEKTAEKQTTTDAQAAKAQKFREVVGKFAIESNKEGGFDVIDQDNQVAISEHSTVDEARAAAKVANSKVKNKIAVEPEIEKPFTPDPIVSTNKNTQSEGYQGKTGAETEKENEYLDQTVDSHAINEEKIGKANKFAYRAKEDDSSAINPDYLILHSKTFNVGTPLVLKVAKETKFYKEGTPNDRLPIGIYNNDKLVGYVALPKEGDYDLKELRNKIILGEVKTTVSAKDFGAVNRSKTKHSTTEAMPSVTTIAIAKDNELLVGVNTPYSGKIVNDLLKSPMKNGVPHAIVTTPTGDNIAIPLDPRRLEPEIVDSLMIAFRIYLNSEDVLPEDNKLLEEIFQKFDIDLRSAKGFEKYFKSFVHNFIFSKSDINELNADKKDKFWIEFDGESIKYLSSGRAVKDTNGRLQPKKVGKKTPPELQEGFIDELTNHLNNMYYNIDLSSIQDNRPINLPILSPTSDQNLTYKEYSKPDYVSHIKAVTETNIVGVKISPTEYTYFVSPKIYFSTSFMGQQNAENYAKPMQKPEEKPILASPKKTRISLTSRLPKNVIDIQQVTKEVIEERIKACE